MWVCRIRGACGRVHFAVVIAILGLDRACFSIKDATRDAGVAIVEITWADGCIWLAPTFAGNAIMIVVIAILIALRGFLWLAGYDM